MYQCSVLCMTLMFSFPPVTFALESSDVEVCEGSGPVFACLSLTSGIGGTVDITVQTADISTDCKD